MSLLLHLLLFVTALCVGSFLNVVISRGPIIWSLVDSPSTTPAKFSLAWPPSHCPHCLAQIRPQHLIPVVGFVILRARCADCGARIAWHYPVIELLTGLLALALMAGVGINWLSLALFIGGCGLIAAAAIDWRTGFLPDAITLPLLWLGLLVNLDGAIAPLRDAVIGAAAGYLSFRLIGDAYEALRGRIGLGRGDAKLLAAIGAWLGWWALPFVIFTASLLGLATALPSLFARAEEPLTAEIRFGPFLAISAALVLAASLAGIGTELLTPLVGTASAP